MDIPEDSSFWLGQRNAAHGFFKVSRRVLISILGALMPFLMCDKWFRAARTSNSSELLQQPARPLTSPPPPPPPACLAVFFFSFYLSSLLDLIACSFLRADSFIWRIALPAAEIVIYWSLFVLFPFVCSSARRNYLYNSHNADLREIIKKPLDCAH